MRSKILKPCLLCRNHAHFRAYSPVVRASLQKLLICGSQILPRQVKAPLSTTLLTSIFVMQGGVLLAKNHCLTKPDKYIRCVVLGAQGGLDEPPPRTPSGSTPYFINIFATKITLISNVYHIFAACSYNKHFCIKKLVNLHEMRKI